MAWRIDFTRNADKAMRKLDKGVAARVFDELDEIYRKDHPRPTEFNAIRKWEKERLMTLEHQVMEEIVYKRRE